MPPASGSTRLVEEVVAKVGGRPSDAAKPLGVTKQHVSRVLKGEGGLGIVAIVRAALLTGRDVTQTLREVAGADAAEVLTSGFGGGTVSRTQRKILDRIHALPAPARRHLLGLLNSWPDPSPDAVVPHTTSPTGKRR